MSNWDSIGIYIKKNTLVVVWDEQDRLVLLRMCHPLSASLCL